MIKIYALRGAILVGVFFLSLIPLGITEAKESRSLIILPFDVHATGDAKTLSAEVEKGLAAELAKSRFIQVIDPVVVSALVKDRRITDALAQEIVEKLDVDYAIGGSIIEIGGSLALELWIITTGKPAPRETIFFHGKLAEGLGLLFKQVAEHITKQLMAGFFVAAVEIKGNKRIESPAILQLLQTRAGTLYSDAAIAADIRSIFKAGYFHNVTVSIADITQGRVVTFEVREYPLISEIVIKGYRAVRRREIEEVMNIRSRQVLDPVKIRGDVQRITDLYRRKGYLNVVVSDHFTIDGAKDSVVTIQIKEGRLLRVRDISFEGNHFFTDRILKDIMTLKEGGRFSFLTASGVLNDEDLRQDLQRIASFYLDNGFLNIQVGDPEINHDERGIYIRIPVVEGRQFRVGKVDISGDTLRASRETLLAGLNLRTGEYYSRGVVLKDIDFLTQAATDEGYAHAEVLPNTYVDETNSTVEISFELRKGRQVFVNRINIVGNTRTRDNVIRRQILLGEGDLFSSSKLRTSFTNLHRLGYFEEVDLQLEPGRTDNLTDVNVLVSERPTGMISVGAGYSALDQAVFTAMIAQQNLFGRGQSLSLRAAISSRATNYDISFVEPWLFDIPLWMKIDAWNMDRDYDTYRLDTVGVGLSFGYPVWRDVSAFIGYRYATNVVSDISNMAAAYIRAQEGRATSITVSTGLTRDTTDDRIFPSRGSRNSISVDYTGGILGGDTAFVRYQLSSSWFIPFPLGTTFSVRGRMGYLARVEDKDVPIYERFVLGGMGSLRGLRNVGPLDEKTRDVIGGLTMLNATLELIYPLMRDAGIKGVLFYDTGNSWLSGYHLDDLRQTAGIGIRWYSPIGPLRLEWGHVLDRRVGEARSRWEFTIGMMM